MQASSSRQPLTRRLLLSLTVLGYVCILADASRAASWLEASGKHVRVFYVEDATRAASVIEWAEYYYSQITLDLGLRHVIKRDRVPWLWDQRCRIYLFPDRHSYLRATRAPPWSGGMVKYRERVIYSFAGATSFLEKTLPHELAHILFREYVGFDNARVPRWLDEGVAQYAEIGRREEALTLMHEGISQGIYIPLGQLNRLPVNHTSGDTARLFYTQAVTLVHFFLDYYGSRRFISLCSSLRDGDSLERALSFATAGRVQSLRQLEDAWRRFILSLP